VTSEVEELSRDEAAESQDRVGRHAVPRKVVASQYWVDSWGKEEGSNRPYKKRRKRREGIKGKKEPAGEGIHSFPEQGHMVHMHVPRDRNQRCVHEKHVFHFSEYQNSFFCVK
jgi:hypothetical protein